MHDFRQAIIGNVLLEDYRTEAAPVDSIRCYDSLDGVQPIYIFLGYRSLWKSNELSRKPLERKLRTKERTNSFDLHSWRRQHTY